MKNIRLLEDRVTRAAQRIRQLAEEKKGLESELEALRRELAGRPAPDSNGELWTAERADMVRTIEETLAELRAD
jgi:hypothetical protein